MPSSPPPLTSEVRGFARFLRESLLLRHYLWKYRRWVAIGLGWLVLVDLLELIPPLLLKSAVEQVTEPAHAGLSMPAICAVYLATMLIQAFGRYGWRMFLIRASMRSGQDLRGNFAEHLYAHDPNFFDRRRLGDLMSVATSDVEAMRMMLGPGILVLADAVFYIATVPIAMLALSPALTLLAFLPLPVIPWLVFRSEQRIAKRCEEAQAAFGNLSARVQEFLGGARVIKAHAKEEFAREKIAALGREVRSTAIARARAQAALGPLMDFSMSMGIVLLLWVGGGWVFGTKTLSLGTLVAFQRYIQKMVWPMVALGMAINLYKRSVSSTLRFEDVVPVGQTPFLPEVERRHVARAPLGLRFKDVCVKRPSGFTLEGISFAVAPGERVALTGPVGCGKTTLFSLLLRLLPLDSGVIELDGKPIEQWSRPELRRRMGFVGQDIFLFSGTIRENILFGQDPFDQVSDARVLESARIAKLHEEVIQFPEGYSTELGERGVRLSGGQRQRLSLARALVREPGVLLLDDVLSAVDTSTEQEILDNLRALGRSSILLSAHRLSTLRSADCVLVLDRGKLVQRGTHSSLIRESQGLYAALNREQESLRELETYFKEGGMPSHDPV